jgi:hypothetical protein
MEVRDETVDSGVLLVVGSFVLVLTVVTVGLEVVKYIVVRVEADDSGVLLVVGSFVLVLTVVTVGG